MQRRMVYWLFITPALALILGLYVFPLLRVLWISFDEPSLGLQNYRLQIGRAHV